MGYSEDFVSQVLLKILLKSESISFDIGAYNGEHTETMAEHGKHVYAFEPEPESALKLSNRSKSNVTVIAKAVSNKAGKIKLYICPTNNGGHSISKNKVWKHEETIDVECIKLDDFVKENNIERLDLIKIDVEGSELEVFQGAEHIIKQFRPSIVFESHLNVDIKAIDKFFKSIDYQVKNTDFFPVKKIEADQHYWAHSAHLHY